MPGSGGRALDAFGWQPPQCACEIASSEGDRGTQADEGVSLERRKFADTECRLDGRQGVQDRVGFIVPPFLHEAAGKQEVVARRLWIAGTVEQLGHFECFAQVRFGFLILSKIGFDKPQCGLDVMPCLPCLRCLRWKGATQLRRVPAGGNPPQRGRSTR